MHCRQHEYNGRRISNLFLIVFQINGGNIVIHTVQSDSNNISIYLKSLGPIDRKFHGNGENDGFVLYEYTIKQCSIFCKYTTIGVMKKCQIK